MTIVVEIALITNLALHKESPKCNVTMKWCIFVYLYILEAIGEFKDLDKGWYIKMNSNIIVKWKHTSCWTDNRERITRDHEGWKEPPEVSSPTFCFRDSCGVRSGSAGLENLQGWKLHLSQLHCVTVLRKFHSCWKCGWKWGSNHHFHRWISDLWV